MELKLLTKIKGRPSKPVKVTDCEGNVKIFNSVKEAAEYLECGNQTIYDYISQRKTIRGCKLERIND